MIFPVKQPHKITQKFSKNHPGIDIAPVIAGTTGVLCLAPEDSIVITSNYRVTPEGNYVILGGASGVYYYFGHFEKRLVAQAQMVGEGQAIGVLGKTGLADGIHTHHEVRPSGPGPGKSIDPEKYYKSNPGGNMGTVPTQALDRNIINDIWQVKRPGTVPPEAYVKAWLGKNPLDMIYDLIRNVPEWSKAGKVDRGGIINAWRIKLPGKTPPENYIKAWEGKYETDLINDLRKNVPEWYNAGPQPSTTKEIVLQYIEKNLK